MGYQTQPPEKGPADVVEVVFKNGDYKSANCLNEKINPKIKFECDLSERKVKFWFVIAIHLIVIN